MLADKPSIYTLTITKHIKNITWQKINKCFSSKFLRRSQISRGPWNPKQDGPLHPLKPRQDREPGPDAKVRSLLCLPPGHSEVGLLQGRSHQDQRRRGCQPLQAGHGGKILAVQGKIFESFIFWPLYSAKEHGQSVR